MRARVRGCAWVCVQIKECVLPEDQSSTSAAGSRVNTLTHLVSAPLLRLFVSVSAQTVDVQRHELTAGQLATDKLQTAKLAASLPCTLASSSASMLTVGLPQVQIEMITLTLVVRHMK